MAKTAKIDVKEQNLLTALQGLFKALLEEGGMQAVLVPQHLPMKNSVMPTLVTDPGKINGVDPLAPVFPMNAAKVVSKLTRRPLDGKIAVVLRPCEIRAFIELVKLKQGRTDEVVLIGTDCYGAYGNVDYSRFAGDDGGDASLRFYENVISGKGTAWEDIDISPACKACEHPVSDSADLQIGMLGVDTKDHLLLKAMTEEGDALLEKLGLPEGEEPEGRKKAIEDLVSKRIAYRDKMFEETSEATSDLNKLTAYLGSCVNCYNCRVACPVCYCKECVFLTDVFDHEPSQYLKWAKRKGLIKMPTDTVFYHMTRLAHMSTACIGCGQCSNACPNDIPVMEIFRTIASYTQSSFDYEAGRSLEDEPPLSVFKEAEYSEVTGGKDQSDFGFLDCRFGILLEPDRQSRVRQDMKRKIGSTLVVGSGISGIRSALDMAEQGYQVTLIDKEPHLGGILTQLDYQFPTDHCGMCKMLPLVERDSSSQYCLRKGLFHENIDIMLSTELVDMEGEPGKFQVTLRQKSSIVEQGRCIGCGECAGVCPVEVPDLFNGGLTNRKAIYLPVPHNIPNAYVVDLDACTHCGECEKICPTHAINFGKEDRKKFRILVVDDELIVRDSLKEWLIYEGFDVDMAESGTEALEKLAKEDFHLMLLDIKMPGMDGVEVLKRAKEMRPDLQAVMMTAYATVETAVEAMKIGAQDYLMKPFDPDNLIPLIVNLYHDIQSAGVKEMEVGSVILAGGFDSYDPATGKNTYGYGLFPNVVTSLQFERMVSGTGPNQGKILRPSDGKEARKIAWFQCVGSRDQQADADFCSSACCMFAIKEALLAKEKSEGEIDTTIFYMDMRTFGKDFQRYRDKAEKESGVHFERSRVHSVEPAEKDDGTLKVAYADTTGTKHEEDFDLVVLAAGQRPPTGAEQLAETCGVALNPWGFCQTEGFSLSRTSNEGVLVGGSFSGLRDISESVIQASSASLEASRLIHSRGGGLAEEVSPETGFRDVSREMPRVLAVLCRCGGTLSESVDLDETSTWLEAQGSVDGAHTIDSLCTQEGWDKLKEILKGNSANRILIAACMPYVYAKKLKELGRSAELNPQLIEVVDIRTLAFPARETEKEAVHQEIRAVLSMGIGKLKGMDPLPVTTSRIAQKALVVGGGIAGMTAGLAIADHGFEVTLIEKEAELGGNARTLHRTIEGHSPQELLEESISKVEKHPLIRTHTGAKIIYSQGHVGNFSTSIENEDGQGETIEHGVTVLATGGVEAKTESYAYGEAESVLTQHELEGKLADGTIDPSNLNAVAMIQCVGSREEPRNYCSRICCQSALKNALFLKEQNPEIDIYVFYRDMMSYGFMETYYSEARKAGVIFIPYDISQKPEVSIEDGRPRLSAPDPILAREWLLEPDLLILSTGVIPDGGREVAAQFEVEVNQDGFFQEAESKWRPVDFIKEGIFMCGLAHSPRSIKESIAMAEASAQRALRILNNERLASGSVVAEVRHNLCALCERCVTFCPYEARHHDEDEEMIVVNELMCQGCGSCAAVCPNSASVLHGYRDQQVFEVIDAALENVVQIDEVNNV